MDPIALAVSAFAAGGLVIGAVVWLVMTLGQQARRIAELERKLSATSGDRAAELKLDHRQQLVSIAALVKLSARDQLDALTRLSPEMTLEVIREIAPHLVKEDE